MIDAGAVFKLRDANIQVGSTEIGVDLSGSAIQILGTPYNSVYFTSDNDTTIGLHDYPILASPAAGDWGCIVFENDLDQSYGRYVSENQGIFLNDVNNASIKFGGGTVTVNSVSSVYDPIYMVDARVTASYNNIEYSHDAAMSADPNSFQESFFEGNTSSPLYTDDYERTGPQLNANLVINNSINGILVRIRTNAGEPIDKLTTSATFSSLDITYVISQNLEIASNPGGPIALAGADSPLIQTGPQELQAVPGQAITAGQTFTIANSTNPAKNQQFEFESSSLTVDSGTDFNDGDTLEVEDDLGNITTFEFESAGASVTVPGYVKIPFSNTDTPGQIEAEIATAINGVFFNVDNTTLQAIAVPYAPGGNTSTLQEYPAGTVALANFDNYLLAFTSVGLVDGMTVVSNTAVPTNVTEVDYTTADTPDQVALEIQAAIAGNTVLNLPANSVIANGPMVTIPATLANGSSGATLTFTTLTDLTPRIAGRLDVLPGVVVKLLQANIETQIGATLIAEGTANDPVIFTSTEDDRYGSGGTFDLTGDGYAAYDPAATTAQLATNVPKPGDWGGFYGDPTSFTSIDHAVLSYAGGVASIEGGFAGFNAVEAREATLRLTNSLLEDNADGTSTATTDTDRNGRGINGVGTVYIVGSQPVIVDNTFLSNDRDRGSVTNDSSPVISADVNSFTSSGLNDWGRSTGLAGAFTEFDGNIGPLVEGNVLGNNELTDADLSGTSNTAGGNTTLLSNNGLNGLLVRAGTITQASVWDDTGITYIVEGSINVPNLQTDGGLRIESSDSASLVVKLLGATAGFAALGAPNANTTSLLGVLDNTTDRIGGSVQIVGQPGYPVVLTSLNDNTVGAGVDLNGDQQDDTVNNPTAVATSGDWNSVLIEQDSNDTNVQVVNETNPATSANTDNNGTIQTAQYLGELASSASAGDENLRLGFEVHGSIPSSYPEDTTVYSFTGTAGTEAYITMDRTSSSLDSVIELDDANGNLIARSDNKEQEDPELGGSTIYLGGSAQPFQEGNSSAPLDDYSNNPLDPSLRVVLPGPGGQVRTYYVRVYSALSIGDVNATTVPNISTLNGQTFSVADSNSLSIGDIDSSHLLPGIGGITAANVPHVASLNGKTFTLTIGATTTTFEFIDTSTALTLTAGDRPIYYNSVTDNITTVATDMANAIGGTTITNINAATVPNVALLSGRTFSITDSANKTVTFEFIDSSTTLVVTASDTAVTYNSKTDSITTILGDMVTAINAAGLNLTAVAEPGSIVLTGFGMTFNAGTTPFGLSGLGLTAIAYQDGSVGISGQTFVFGAGTTPFRYQTLTGLNDMTFQITDSAGKIASFEFIDTSVAGNVASANEIAIDYNSTDDTVGDIQAGMVGAINDAGLQCTALEQLRRHN